MPIRLRSAPSRSSWNSKYPTRWSCLTFKSLNLLVNYLFLKIKLKKIFLQINKNNKN